MFSLQSAKRHMERNALPPSSPAASVNSFRPMLTHFSLTQKCKQIQKKKMLCDTVYPALSLFLLSSLSPPACRQQATTWKTSSALQAAPAGTRGGPVAPDKLSIPK